MSARPRRCPALHDGMQCTRPRGHGTDTRGMTHRFHHDDLGYTDWRRHWNRIANWR